MASRYALERRLGLPVEATAGRLRELDAAVDLDSLAAEPPAAEPLFSECSLDCARCSRSFRDDCACWRVDPQTLAPRPNADQPTKSP